jgi:hypothetical protein
MIEPEFLLELLVPLHDLPADFQTPTAPPVWPSLASGQRIADRAIAPPFREQPACIGTRVRHVVSPAAHAPAVRRPDVDSGELGLQRSLTACRQPNGVRSSVSASRLTATRGAPSAGRYHRSGGRPRPSTSGLRFQVGNWVDTAWPPTMPTHPI